MLLPGEINRPICLMSSVVTLCRWSAKQTTPLSAVVRNQTKGFGLEISTRPEVGKGTPVESWKKELREGVGDGRGRRAVGSRHRTTEETSQHEIRSSSSEGRPVKMSQHSSWFVEFSLEIHGSVSLQGIQCHNLTFLHLS